MDFEKEVSSIKSVIEKAKQDKARLEGSIETNMNSLKESYGLNSIEEAKEFIEKKNEENKVLTDRLTNQITKIKEELGDG